ncbi:response regulator [Planctomycetota bacterium]
MQRPEMQFPILDSLKVGVSVINRDFAIQYINEEMVKCGWKRKDVLGALCYQAYKDERGVCSGCVAREAFRTGEKQEAIEEGRDGRLYEVIASPIPGPDGEVEYVAEITRDVTSAVLFRRRLESLYQSVDRLLGILPIEIMPLSHEERVELIRSRIGELFRDLLPYDNLLVDVINPTTQRLEPLIICGSFNREELLSLDRRPGKEGSGITGMVATNGRSYRCDNVRNDPLYLPGISDSKASMTVPLRIAGDVLGTMNVESKEEAAFTKEDLQYLEIFGHFVAMALHAAFVLRRQGQIVSVRRVAELLADRLNNSLAAVITHAHLLQQTFIQDKHYYDSLDVVRRESEASFKLLEQRFLAEDSYVGELQELDRRVDDVLDRLRETVRLDDGETEVQIEVDILKRSFEGLHVLVAEDQKHILSALETILTSWGFSCDTAKDGREAIKRLEKGRYDLVLSDLNMPHCSGVDVFEAARKADDSQPVVFITGGWDPDHQILQLLEEQRLTNPFVVRKPFRLVYLKSVIAKALSDRPSNT